MLEWILAALILLQGMALFGMFWFWKWTVQRLHHVESEVVKVKYQEATPVSPSISSLEADHKVLKGKLDDAQVQILRVKERVDRVEKEILFELTEDEADIRNKLMNALPTVESVESSVQIPYTPSTLSSTTSLKKLLQMSS